MNNDIKRDNMTVKTEILQKIRESDKIIITRHIRPDGDAIGSSQGLCRILRLSYPDKDVRVVCDDSSGFTASLGDAGNEAGDAFYREALLIVTDTATEDRISNKKHCLAKFTVKIDHHIETSPYGGLCWIEDWRSSACEMIVDFLLSFPGELKADGEAATFLYTGMVTDSGRFRYSSVTGETLRCAGALLDIGVNTERLFAKLYLEDAARLKYKAHVYRKMKLTPDGVAYLYVDRKMQRRFSMTEEDASNTVYFLDSLSGSIIWLAFIEYGDGSTRVRLRSRFVTINKLAEKYGGGGHAMASGATVHSRREARALLRDANELIKTYKSENTGWL